MEVDGGEVLDLFFVFGFGERRLQGVGGDAVYGVVEDLRAVDGLIEVAAEGGVGGWGGGVVGIAGGGVMTVLGAGVVTVPGAGVVGRALPWAMATCSMVRRKSSVVGWVKR